MNQISSQSDFGEEHSRPRETPPISIGPSRYLFGGSTAILLQNSVITSPTVKSGLRAASPPSGKDAATGPTPISKEPPAPLFKRLGGACAAPYNQLIGT